MPSSKPSPFSFIDMDELREQLNFMINDIYSKLDYALALDGKGIISSLIYGGMGRDISAFNGLLYVASGASGQLALGTGLVFDATTGRLYLNVTTAGDILAGTANQAMARLPIGTSGQVLSVGGAHATGLQWANAVLDTLYDDNSILKADSDNTPIVLPLGASTIVARLAAGGIVAATPTEIRTLLGLATTDSPVFVTAKLSGLSNGKIPYHVDDATGLADGPTKTDVDSAVSAAHARSHSITGTSDHTSTATAGKVLKADANGLPVESVIVVAATGAVTNPSQPAFLATADGTQTNIATASNVKVLFATEIYDQGANLASSTFTAPVTGKYHFDILLYLNALDSATRYFVSLVTSNRTLNLDGKDFTQMAGDLIEWTMGGGTDVDMDAGDTAHVVIYQVGGTQQTDIASDSRFSGHLLS